MNNSHLIEVLLTPGSRSRSMGARLMGNHKLWCPLFLWISRRSAHNRDSHVFHCCWGVERKSWSKTTQQRLVQSSTIFKHMTWQSTKQRTVSHPIPRPIWMQWNLYAIWDLRCPYCSVHKDQIFTARRKSERKGEHVLRSENIVIVESRLSVQRVGVCVGWSVWWCWSAGVIKT